MTCPVCGDAMPPTNRAGNPRRACSQRCSARLAIQTRWRLCANRCEDAVELLEFGESPEQIAVRLGTTVGALARLLHRHGRHDAGRVFDRASRRAAA